MPFIEFAFNRSVHSTTDYSLFEIIYHFNPITPLDLIHLSIDKGVSLDDNKRSIGSKRLTSKDSTINREKKNEQYAFKANRGWKLVWLKPGD